jgi:hypothetical protein
MPVRAWRSVAPLVPAHFPCFPFFAFAALLSFLPPLPLLLMRRGARYGDSERSARPAQTRKPDADGAICGRMLAWAVFFRGAVILKVILQIANSRRAAAGAIRYR